MLYWRGIVYLFWLCAFRCVAETPLLDSPLYLCLNRSSRVVTGKDTIAHGHNCTVTSSSPSISRYINYWIGYARQFKDGHEKILAQIDLIQRAWEFLIATGVDSRNARQVMDFAL